MAGLVAFAAGVATTAGAEPPADSVTLAFAWTSGFRADVESVRTRVRVSERRTSQSATSRYRLEAVGADPDLRVRFRDPKLDLDALGPLPPAARAQLVAQVADLMPDYVVTPTGRFVGLHDLPGFQERLQAFLVEILPSDVDPRAMAQIQQLLTSEALLQSRAAEQWNAIVGAWAGAELEIGETYTHAAREPVPMFPDHTVLMNYAFSASRRVPCSRAGTAQSCVELEMRSSADPDDTRRTIESVLARLAPGQRPAGGVFSSLQIENVIRLVTEPDGLVPHSCTITKSIDGVVSTEGRQQAVRQTDNTITRYTYE